GEEPLAKSLILGQLGGDQLERDRPLQAWVVRLVDDPHAAPPEQRLEAIAEQLGADRRVYRERHCPPCAWAAAYDPGATGLRAVSRGDGCAPVARQSLRASSGSQRIGADALPSGNDATSQSSLGSLPPAAP